MPHQLLAPRTWILLFFVSLTRPPEGPDPYPATGKVGACEHAVNPRITDNPLLAALVCSQLPPSCLSSSNVLTIPSLSTTSKGGPDSELMMVPSLGVDLQGSGREL